MATVRLLSIPAGVAIDSDGIGLGDDWPILDLGTNDTGSHYLTTDHCHGSDLCDDAVAGDPEALGSFIVRALNNRPPLGLYRQAVKLWGPEAQMLMLVEECAELQQAVLYLGRGRINKETLAGEIADVLIMIEQATMMLGIGSLVEQNRGMKLDRLRDRVQKAQEADRKANPTPEPEPEVYIAPDPTAKNCGTCKHWLALLVMDPMEDTTGVCDNPTRPWEARSEPDDAWAAAARASDEFECWEAK